MRAAFITTTDNPYDPVKQFDDWDTWDRMAGYYTSARLGRIALTSPELSPADQSLAVELAIDSIVKHEPNTYKKIVVEIEG